MVASAVFILDYRGKIIISRNYRGDIPVTVAEKFTNRIQDVTETAPPPVYMDDGIAYVHVSHNNLYLLSVTRKNSNVTMLLSFLHKFVKVLEEYFGAVEEESIRDNFVIIYELLDEVMDFGYPQYTEPKVLKEYISQESHKLERPPEIPTSVTNATSWRREGIKYRKNEIFLDVVEKVNLLVAADGSVLNSEINGSLQMRCYLSGMPELKLGLNDKVFFERSGKTAKGKTIEMEDMKFHQCVRLARFENDRTIAFIPPDGEFELMTYRLDTHVKPLVWVETVVESFGRSRVEYLVKLRSQFKARSTANSVKILIPVPQDADSPTFKTNIGSVKYAPEKDCIEWRIRQLQGGKEYMMAARFGLPSVESDSTRKEKPVITCEFEIPYYTVSGVQVRYLKIMEKSGYQALPWVRYITQNGSYQLRMGS
mmetsp:Transcript_19379/g.49676  ORF Transcript_19379/g.49676 Transcript_19379/m.49676 type:complete len:425 (-) Transcript_19379:582-1856(-)